MSNLISLTSAQLNRAADLKEQISRLERELFSILGERPASVPSPKKRKFSAAARAKIAAAQKARWAKLKGTKPAAKPVAKKKSKMSAAGRARISAAAKARWAKAKAAGKTSL